MRSVDFICFPGCPNVEQARAHLAEAFAAIGAEPRWVEWDSTDPATPEEFRHYGSPTILINGRDIAGAEPLSGDGCRVYETAEGLTGVPPVALLVHALRDAPSVTAVEPAPVVPGWRRVLAVLPSLGLAAVPIGACPICFAGTVGVLGALGFGFLLDTRFLIPITGAALLLALASLAWRARSRQGYGPLALGIVGAVLLIVGQFVNGNLPTTVIGATALLVAALWNVWPRPQRGLPCDACAPRRTRASHQ